MNLDKLSPPPWLQALVASLGGFGIFAAAFLDASVLSLPVINDILVIRLSIQNPAAMPFYATMATLGSLAGRKLTEEKEPRALFLGMALIALSTGAIAVSPWFAPILVMSLMSGFGDAVTMVAEQGIQQRRTPDAVRSRVVSASEAIITVAFALSLVAAGPVLEALGPQNVYAIGGATALAGSAVLLPVLRGERRRSVLDAEPTMQVELG